MGFFCGMNSKKVLVVGSGGREHAICWTLQNTSAHPLDLYCAPGNAGIASCAQVVPIAPHDIQGLIDFALSRQINLTFVGPEAPLTAGLVDAFEAESVSVVGPHRTAARLEGSKVFAKDFMARHKIPTAAYGVANSLSEALDIVRGGRFGSSGQATVIKADGLAAGKGVIVAASVVDAENAVEDLMVKNLAGPGAADRVVIEEGLVGKEVSLLLFCDGRDYVLMPAARDHKRIGEGDTGPNTGGMGSITGASILDQQMLETVVREIVEPTIEGARTEGFPFKGVLFLGLMLTSEGPKLLEYNVRFGDPETQAILVRLKTDLLSIFEAIRAGGLRNINVEWREGASACVVAANRGYPGKYASGAIIEGLETATREVPVQIFHAGTSVAPSGDVIASGGRVLGVTAEAEDLKIALNRCYDALGFIHWEGMQYRRDIGRTIQ